MSKDAYYFPHDSNARQDQKILQMRSVYKSEGYGWYWILIEMLRDEENYELSIEGKYVWNAFAMQMDTNAEKAEAFIKDCISEFNLLQSDSKKIWSNSLKNRMLIKEEKSLKARASAKARWEKKPENIENTNDECESNANVLQTQYESNASKVKESKVNKSKSIIDAYTENENLKQAINDFILMRKQIKKPMTDRAVKLMLNDLDKLTSCDETKISILNQSIQHCWQGVFELKNQVINLKPAEQQYQPKCKTVD